MDSGLILVVDDEVSIRRVLHDTLGGFGFKTVEADCSQDALSLTRAIRFDAVLLDINMPGLNGIETCTIMRRLRPRLPILMLSVCDTEDDKVGALDAGADDYITKPFRLRELAARIRAVMRLANTPDRNEDKRPSVLRVRDIELDPVTHTAKRADRPLHLTPKEFKLAHELMKLAGQSVSHSRLLNSVWGTEHSEQLHGLRTLMHELRKKLEDDPANPTYLVTDAHFGYRFVESL